jgi:molybdopterin converting factor small subunit
MLAQATTGWRLINNKINIEYMEVTVMYSGILAEKAGKSKESFSGVKSLNEIRKMLAGRYDGFSELHYVIALNGVIVHEDARVEEGDQVALIPPIPGG